MMEFLTEFVKKYYIDPIVYGTGYNFINSTTYALLFIGAIYLIFLFLKKTKIPIDKRFLIAIFPYVMLGSLVRVLEDAKIVTNYFLVTPMIWAIFVFGIFFLLAISRLIERKFNIQYFKIMFIISILLISIPITLLTFKNFFALFLVAVFFLPWIIISCFVKWNIKNKLVTLAHIFDATASAVAISSFNFFEQYPLPRFLSNVNPFLYIIVKASVVVGILILIDKVSKEKDYNNYLKLIIGILGFAPGLRNLISLMVLV
jgi:uncharacterized membrane protein